MDEHLTRTGLTLDVAGYFPVVDETDYWRGRPAAGGFAFAEHRGFIRSRDMRQVTGMSTNGSIIFGDRGDPDTLIVYYTRTHAETHSGGGCGNWGGAWGDSHGDILVSTDHTCLAQPEGQ
jgi:hypothetical protein